MKDEGGMRVTGSLNVYKFGLCSWPDCFSVGEGGGGLHRVQLSSQCPSFYCFLCALIYLRLIHVHPITRIFNAHFVGIKSSLLIFGFHLSDVYTNFLCSNASCKNVNLKAVK